MRLTIFDRTNLTGANLSNAFFQGVSGDDETLFNSTEIPNTLELKATSWINQLSGYITVDLQGSVLSDEKRIVGNVLNAPNCTKFDVVKVGQNR